MKDRFYIERQTREGKNYGNWWVKDPSGVSIIPCESRALAVQVCAAFQLASQHPEGELIRFRQPWAASAEDWNGRRFPLHKDGSGRVGSKK